jgi:hypothetical protein
MTSLMIPSNEISCSRFAWQDFPYFGLHLASDTCMLHEQMLLLSRSQTCYPWLLLALTKGEK